MNVVLFISTGSSVYGIFQEGILEWVATFYSSESSLHPRIKPSPLVSRALASRFFTTSGTWRRHWHPAPVLLSGESHGRRSLWAAVHGVAESWTRLSDFIFTHWRRKWQPTPVFLPGESQGWGSLLGCRLWGHTESDTTEVT